MSERLAFQELVDHQPIGKILGGDAQVVLGMKQFHDLLSQSLRWPDDDVLRRRSRLVLDCGLHGFDIGSQRIGYNGFAWIGEAGPRWVCSRDIGGRFINHCRLGVHELVRMILQHDIDVACKLTTERFGDRLARFDTVGCLSPTTTLLVAVRMRLNMETHVNLARRCIVETCDN